LLLVVSFYLFLYPFTAIADNSDELKQEIQQKLKRVGGLIYSEPTKVLNEVNNIRDKYKNELALTDLADLIYIEAWGYMNTNQYQLALNTIEKINQLTRPEINNFDYQINDTKGAIYGHMGKAQKSLKYHLFAYKHVKDKLKYQNLKAKTESNVGFTFIQLGFYQEALPYLKRVLAYNLSIDNPVLRAIAYNNLGEALFHLKQIDKAYEHHQKALKIRIEHKLVFHSSYSYHNLALIYSHKKRYQQAKDYLLKAIQIRTDSNFALGILESQLSLAKVYQQISDIRGSSALLRVVIDNAIKHKQLNILAKAYLLQSDLFSSQDEYQQALSAHKLYHQTLEDVQIKKTDSKLTQYITQTSTVAKDINILQLEKENEIQQLAVVNRERIAIIILISAVIIVTALSFFLWLLHLKRKKIQTINQDLSLTLDKLKATQDKLIESEKMSALTTLVSGMAHQMNTPLGIAITSISLIEENINTFSEALRQGQIKRKSIESILNNVGEASKLALSSMDKTANLVSQFKKISAKLEGDEKQEFELINHLIIQAEQIMGQLHNDQLEVNVYGSKVKISSYPTALNRVLSHLIHNSIEHGFCDTETPKIDIKIKKQPNSVEIRYQDNGKGIDIEKISDIFTPFYTSKMGSDNVGLGLSIVYNLVVQLMQGRITVESAENKGTIFSINLPIQLAQLD